MVIGKHSVTADTAKSVLLGAGTYLKGLTYSSGGWSGTPIGATSGGGKFALKGEFIDLDIDGALVKFKGQTVKQGGTAVAEVNFVELNPDLLKTATLFAEESSDVDGFIMLQDKATIEEGDYLENFGFVGYMADGVTQIIIIFESAICTSGMEIEAKNKEQTVVKLTLEAVAQNTGNLDVLPVKIYYPTGD